MKFMVHYSYVLYYLLKTSEIKNNVFHSSFYPRNVIIIDLNNFTSRYLIDKFTNYYDICYEL